MKTLKVQLLAATIVAGSVPTIAHAQFAYPAAELRGAGASSIQNVLVQTLNCFGNPGDHSATNTDNLNKLGTNAGALNTVPEGKFVQTSPTPASPDYDCNLQEIQPKVEGRYVATGSGTGRKFWNLFSNQLTGGTGTSNQNPFGVWSNVQFAFSDAPVSSGDLSTYDSNANSAANGAGAPIQFPLYVLPVAIAYNPVYGRLRTTNGTTDLTFAVKPTYVTTDSAGNPTGGLRMTRNLYCKIFNGYVTNFNDPAFRSTGTNNTLQDTNDSTTRWRSAGVPIRLVGRLDSSGTTDIFSRHLAAACTGQAGVATNKFLKNAEALPFDVNSNIDLRGFRADTRYYPSTPTVPNANSFAGTAQSLSGAVFVRASGGTLARIDTTQGTEQSKLFLVTDGSSGVRDAINFQEDPSNTVGNVALNGKLGYIGADFVKPSTGAALFSAALQIGGTGTKYASATADQAVAAFGTTRYLPPQTTKIDGSYNASDARVGPTRDGSAGTVPIDRANPLHWTSVLYSNASDTLAAPRVGYPITGTTQFLGYTCYATPANRTALVGFLSLYTGRLLKDSNGDPVSANIFKGTLASRLGLLAQLNIAPMPDAWQTAINDTFLRKASVAALANKNLWIQDKLPVNSVNNSHSNSQCTAGKGA